MVKTSENFSNPYMIRNFLFRIRVWLGIFSDVWNVKPWWFSTFSYWLGPYTLKSCTTVRCEVCWVCEVPCTLHLAPCNFCWVPCNHFTRNFFLRSSFPITSLHKYVSFNCLISCTNMKEHATPANYCHRFCWKFINFINWNFNESIISELSLSQEPKGFS